MSSSSSNTSPAAPASPPVAAEPPLNLSTLPDLCLVAVFRRLPLTALLGTVPLVCQAWSRLHRWAVRRRTHLTLIRVEECNGTLYQLTPDCWRHSDGNGRNRIIHRLFALYNRLPSGWRARAAEEEKHYWSSGSGDASIRSLASALTPNCNSSLSRGLTRVVSLSSIQCSVLQLRRDLCCEGDTALTVDRLTDLLPGIRRLALVFAYHTSGSRSDQAAANDAERLAGLVYQPSARLILRWAVTLRALAFQLDKLEFEREDDPILDLLLGSNVPLPRIIKIRDNQAELLLSILGDGDGDETGEKPLPLPHLREFYLTNAEPWSLQARKPSGRSLARLVTGGNGALHLVCVECSSGALNNRLNFWQSLQQPSEDHQAKEDQSRNTNGRTPGHLLTPKIAVGTDCFRSTELANLSDWVVCRLQQLLFSPQGWEHGRELPGPLWTDLIERQLPRLRSLTTLHIRLRYDTRFDYRGQTLDPFSISLRSILSPLGALPVLNSLLLSFHGSILVKDDPLSEPLVPMVVPMLASLRALQLKLYYRTSDRDDSSICPRHWVMEPFGLDIEDGGLIRSLPRLEWFETYFYHHQTLSRCYSSEPPVLDDDGYAAAAPPLRAFIRRNPHVRTVLVNERPISTMVQ